MNAGVDRLPARVQAKINITDTCWVWTAATNSRGYGSVAVGHGKRPERVA